MGCFQTKPAIPYFSPLAEREKFGYCAPGGIFSLSVEIRIKEISAGVKIGHEEIVQHTMFSYGFGAGACSCQRSLWPPQW